MKLERYQKDWPIHKDICMDVDGNLTMGVDDGLYYVAEVDIPGKRIPGTRSRFAVRRRRGGRRHSADSASPGYGQSNTDTVGDWKRL